MLGVGQPQGGAPPHGSNCQLRVLGFSWNSGSRELLVSHRWLTLGEEEPFHMDQVKVSVILIGQSESLPEMSLLMFPALLTGPHAEILKCQSKSFSVQTGCCVEKHLTLSESLAPVRLWSWLLLWLFIIPVKQTQIKWIKACSLQLPRCHCPVLSPV